MNNNLEMISFALLVLSLILQSSVIIRQEKRIEELELFRDEFIEGIVEAVEDEYYGTEE